MKNLFIGFLILFLNPTKTFGTNNQFYLELLPDFLGYCFILYGIMKLENAGNKYLNIKSYIRMMVLFSGVIWVINAVGIGAKYSNVMQVINSIETILRLFLTFKIVKILVEIEKEYNIDLNTSGIKSDFNIIALFSVISMAITILIVILAGGSMINEDRAAISVISAFGSNFAWGYGIIILALSIVICIFSIKFLVKLYSAYKTYDSLNEKNL